MKSLRNLAFATLVAVPMGSVAGFAADYNMIMAHTLSDPSNPLYQAFEKIANDLEERSEGRIAVDHQSGGALGGDRELMESLLLGDVQFVPISTSGAVQFVPEFAAFDLPYTLPADKTALRKVTNDSALTEKYREILADRGLVFGGIFDAGFRNLTTASTEVHSPEDIAGAELRIRVMENPVHIGIWDSLGAAPTPIAFPELYGALQQGVVDGQENPYGHILSQKFYEVQDYLMTTSHIFLANVNLVNKEWYDSLPEDLQTVFDEVVIEATDYAWQTQADMEADMRAELAKSMTIIDLSPEELAKFRESTTGVAVLVREKAGDEIVDLMIQSVDEATAN